MAIDIQIVNADPTTFLSLNQIVEDIAAIIKAHIDADGSIGIRIYPYWIYEAEPITMLGTVTADVKVNNPGNLEHNLIHAWSIGVSSMVIQKGVDGFQTPIMGAQNMQYSRESNIDVWGFFNDDGTKESQQKAVDETRLIQAAFQANGTAFKREYAGFDSLGTLDFSNINKTPFSDGSSVIVATGAVPFVISEQLTVS